jgi:hypothetical protein
MAIKFKEVATKKREVVSAGSHVARIVKIIEIGRTTYTYLGEEKQKYAVEFTFELPNELRVFNEDKGEQPFVVSHEYNLSRYEKAKLMIHLGSLENKVFTEDEMLDLDVASYIGRACMITLVHKVSKKGNTYANVQSVSSVPKGLKVPEIMNVPLVWDYDTNFDLDVFDSFPEWLQEKIQGTPQWEEKRAERRSDVVADIKFNKEEEEEENNNLPF